VDAAADGRVGADGRAASDGGQEVGQGLAHALKAMDRLGGGSLAGNPLRLTGPAQAVLAGLQVGLHFPFRARDVGGNP
jgi:hypothetical protein